MSNYDARHDPFWGTIETSPEGCHIAILKLLRQRHALTQAGGDVLRCAERGDTDSLAQALADLQQIITEVETIWCEQCGDRPARHFGIANLCDVCQCPMEEQGDEDDL
ncbi:MAG: hypothetical protein JXB13_18735 [Phycisphaerae bacterium]|nr:hypothetical protein [Phycisphaerae bacterium]